MNSEPTFLDFSSKCRVDGADRLDLSNDDRQRPMGQFDHLTERELFDRLGWFISIRWGACLFALLLVLVGWYGFKVHIPPRPVVITICVVLLYNAIFLMLVTDAYRRRRVSRRFILGCANAQIICDLTVLSVLMHFTGGVENYFMIFFVCPMVIACELLTSPNAYAHAVLGSILINVVAWAEYAGLLSHVAVGEAIGAEIYRNPVSVAKFVSALSVLMFVIVFLGSSISTRLRQRERQLEAAYTRLAHLEESKSFFMRKTSHELRAPLNAVIMMLQAIRTEAESTGRPQLKNFLESAVARTQALSRLIHELHRYAMLRETALRGKAETVDLMEIVRASVALYAPMSQAKQLQIETAVEPVPVKGDGEALVELVGNFITNAIQYTPAGGRVMICLRRDDGNAVLNVQDTGIGIAPQDVPRVFDEFYRAANAKSTFRHGTGMGLPICKKIAQAHGGDLAIESELGKGSLIKLRLPCAESSS